MDSLPPLLSIRRSTLIIAITLGLYAFARNPGETQITLSMLGLPLPIPRLIFDVLLPGLCFISGIRYLYHAVSGQEIPWVVRRDLFKNKIPPPWYNEKGELPGAAVYNKICSYFPFIKKERVTIRSPESSWATSKIERVKGLKVNCFDGTLHGIERGEIALTLKILWFTADFDYFFSAILSLISFVGFLVIALN